MQERKGNFYSTRWGGNGVYEHLLHGNITRSLEDEVNNWLRSVCVLLSTSASIHPKHFLLGILKNIPN